jgi:superfamily II DNA or RNA helicase
MPYALKLFMPLFNLLGIDNFDKAKEVSSKSISDAALATVAELDEKSEIEAWIQSILFDTNRTPHGPAEIVDILTHKLSVRGNDGLGAFILKGKSFPTVRPAHVAHQIFRLERIPDLRFAVFAASGNVLDEVKEQFVSTAKRLRSDYCILDAHDLARLFVGFGFICPRDGHRIRGGRCSCGYSPTTRTSNVLQIEAVRELDATHRIGHRSGAIILPTGAGKTRVAVADVCRTKAKVCVYVAHSHEILEAAEEEFLRVFPAHEVQRFASAPTLKQLKKVNLITILTLARNLDVFEGVEVDYMIVDEFHHAAAASYRRVMDQIRPRFLLGLTATPFRGDRQDVLQLCNNNVVVCYELREGIEFGVLCPYHYFGCFDDVDYSRIRHNGIRYDIADLERALIIPERDAAIVTKWEEKASGKPTLAFCCSHRHAERVARSFREAGVEAATYLSSTEYHVRKQLREALRTGALKVLCVVDVLNEGVDLPFVECLLFLRPTESKLVFFQQLGRGLRRFVGKDHCIVVDFIGNFKNAFRVVENLGLEPYEDEEVVPGTAGSRSSKSILNLPLGCKVEFDERVINVFGAQTLNPAFATRHNISRILIHRFLKLQHRLGHRPTRKELNRNSLLGSSLYELVFGSWVEFLQTLDK